MVGDDETVWVTYSPVWIAERRKETKVVVVVGVEV